MKNGILATVMLILATAGSAVSAGSAAGNSLEREIPELIIYQENEIGLPLFVAGRLSDSVTAGNEIDAAMAFFDKHREAYRMASPAEELVPKRIDRDQLGMRHIRFQQQHRGLNVLGGDMIAHFDAAGNLRAVNGYYEPEIDLETSPGIDSPAAADRAVIDLAASFAPGTLEAAPELIVFP